MQVEVKVLRGLIVSALMALIFIWQSVEAAESSVVISELMWDGSEYVELFNATGADVSLSGWQLTRQQASGAERTVVAFEDGDIIGAGEYFLIEKKEDATAVSAHKIVSGLTLVNTGELVKLKDSSGNLVDSANQLGSWFAGEDTTMGAAMERSDSTSDGTQADSWHTSTGNVGERVGTPGQANTARLENGPPQAAISADIDEIAVHEPVVFSAEDSVDPNGDVLTYQWDFGDGVSGLGSVVTHIYASGGSKTAHVTVSDGALSATASVAITVSTPVYSSDIVVNEFLPDPVGSDTDNEFIEIFNTGGAAATFSGWRIDDADGGSTPYVVPAGTTLPANGYISFTRTVTKIALNNDGDSVRLLAPDESVKSQASYDDSTEGLSWNRTSSGTYEESTTLTAGAKNVITQPTATDSDPGSESDEEVGDYSDKIVINELLPNPVGADTELEFIELLNTGSSSVNLTSWKLDDEDGGSAAYSIPMGKAIGAKGFLTLRRSETKLALNNDADSVRLIDPAGKEISSFTYEESMAEGVAWARDGQGKYQLTATTTEGKTNVITLPSSSGNDGRVAGVSAKTVALKDVRGEPEGTVITTEGVVSANPGMLGKGVFYVAGSGIQIYFSDEEYPELEIGDKIKVTGELASYLGEARLRLASASDMNVMGKAEAPLPHQVKTGEIGEALEGTLVVVVGRVSETSGDTFYVDDGSGAVKIFIKESTEIEKPKMKKGDLVTITGVVSQTTSGYRILPRFQEDVRLGAVAGLKTFPGTGLHGAFRRQGGLALLDEQSMLLLIFVAIWLSGFASRDNVAAYAPYINIVRQPSSLPTKRSRKKSHQL